MSSPTQVTISDGVAEAVVVPELGAGLASYDLVDQDERIPLLRPCRDLAPAHPSDLACNLLLPWSNRISGGGFLFAGTFHPLAPNLEGEPYPIHGNGFSSAWTVAAATARAVQLTLASDGPGPFRYRARAAYALERGALTMRLSIANHAREALPFGLGFHPWIVRTQGTLLEARAERVVLETSDHLPAREAAVSSRPEWDFAAPRLLPDGWINNAFLGWDGKAVVDWRDRGVQLLVEADPPLCVYILYSPSRAANFFCFEPVTHPVDAHNAPGGPAANGLVILAPQAALAASCGFEPRRLWGAVDDRAARPARPVKSRSRGRSRPPGRTAIAGSR